MQENEIHHAWKTIIDMEIRKEKERKKTPKKNIPKHHLIQTKPKDGTMLPMLNICN